MSESRDPYEERIRQETARRKKQKNFMTGSAVVAFILIATIILGLVCTTKIDPGYAGVVYNMNGGLEDSTLTQGVKVLAPWKHVTSYPVSTETMYMSKSSDKEGKDDDSINAGTADGKPVNMDVTYSYHYEPTKLKEVFTKFRGQSAETIANSYIRREIKNAINTVSTQYGIFDIYGNKRTEIADKAYKLAAKNLAPLIVLENLNVTEVRPDQDTMAAIQNKVNALQALEQVKVEADKAKIEAEKKKTEAEGDAAKKKIEADAQAYANAKLQQSISKELIQYTIAQKWDGKQPIVNGSGNSILDLGSIMEQTQPAKK